MMYNMHMLASFDVCMFFPALCKSHRIEPRSPFSVVIWGYPLRMDGWFMMEKSMNMDDLGVRYHHFRKPPVVFL